MTAANTASASREVLERCDYLLTELRAEPKGIAWQAKLSATIALLRSVGHILERESKASKSFETAVKQWWKGLKQRKPKPEIFWQFMEDERNLILKEGQLRAGQSVAITLVGATVIALAGDQVAPPPAPQQSPQAIYSYHMNDGPFSGRDPRELVAEAIMWWRTELQAIEKIASSG
jgi:hypothetical protein